MGDDKQHNMSLKQCERGANSILRNCIMNFYTQNIFKKTLYMCIAIIHFKEIENKHYIVILTQVILNSPKYRYL